jgi:hypothetical protein
VRSEARGWADAPLMKPWEESHEEETPLTELETYVVLAKELAFCSDAQELESSIDRVLALIGGLMNSERAREVR